MERSEFRIGETFYTAAGGWVCTDIGTRVVVAIEYKFLADRPAGPPYEWNETVFDEYDLPACAKSPYDDA